jgi:hypothetical protein
MEKMTRILWALVALMSIGAGLLSVFLLRSSDRHGDRPILMPMYTFAEAVSDPKTSCLGILVQPPDADLVGESWGVELMHSLARGAYLGPTLGPEEIAAGIVHLETDPDLALSPAQVRTLEPKVKAVAASAAEIERLTRELAGLMGEVECAVFDLAARLPDDVRSGFPGEYACPDGATGAALWQSLADYLEGADR